MFHKRKPKPFLQFQPTSGKQLIKRAATLAAGIFFLWIALHIMPKPGGNIPATKASTQEPTLLSKDASESQNETFGFLKSTQIIAGVLLLALMGYMYFRYKKTEQERASIRSLKTLNRIQLSPNQHLYLIECGKDALLLGATNTHITLLKNVPLASLKDDSANESARSVSYSFTAPVSTHQDPGDFASLLHSYSSANTN